MNQPLFQQERKAVVLLVEDNADHAFLASEAFEDADRNIYLKHVDNGEKALAFLRRQPPHEAMPRPDLILLDIHMPRMNGFEVMEAIVKDEKLRSIPVVVLTTSAERLDIDRMYLLGCNTYIVKPVDFTIFSEMMQQLADYWFKLSVLPSQPG